jgi:hypothetical protein
VSGQEMAQTLQDLYKKERASCIQISKSCPEAHLFVIHSLQLFLALS